jgi:hypothetical protein
MEFLSYAFFILIVCLLCPTHLTLLHEVKGADGEAPHYEVFSSFAVTPNSKYSQHTVLKYPLSTMLFF